MEHVEYLPTQVVTDYFRNNFTTHKDTPIQGIVYKSSRKGGQAACVLFFDSTDCGDTSASSLQLLDDATERLSADFRQANELVLGRYHA